MKLYHFTCREHLDSIKEHGLFKGEVPLSATHVENAVNLTTSPSPEGHGVYRARMLSPAECEAVARENNAPVRYDLKFADKTAVRITVEISTDDPKLISWRKVRERLEPKWREAIERRNQWRTWWLYSGTIPPSAFTAIEFRNGDTLGYLSDRVPVAAE